MILYSSIPLHKKKEYTHTYLLCVCICMFVYMFARISIKKNNQDIYLYTSVLFEMPKIMARYSGI